MIDATSIALITSIISFVASVIATGVSIYNSGLKRFSSQRWWERKAELYSRVIENLSDVVYYHEAHIDAAMEMTRINQDVSFEMWKVLDEKRTELKKTTSTCGFLLSRETGDALRALWKDHHPGIDPEDWFSLMDANYDAAKKCLDAVVIAAKKDLDVGR